MRDILKELILYIISRFPRGVGRTRLMKILFLIDATAKKELNHVVTGVEWRRWWFGPFSRDVLDVLDELVEEGVVDVNLGPETRYISLADGDFRLSPDIKMIADRVVSEYGFMPLNKLLESVYTEFRVNRLPLGEKISLDWKGDYIKLALDGSKNSDALMELVGRLYDNYSDALEALPKDALLLYKIAVSYLGNRDPKKLEEITVEFIETLEDIANALKKSGHKPLSPELKRRIKKIYDTLLEIAAEAIEGGRRGK